MEKKKNNLRYVAGACFAGVSVIYLISLVLNGFDFWTFLEITGFMLIAISMFASKPVFMNVGAGACAVSWLQLFILYFTNSMPLLAILQTILLLAFFLILLFVGTNKKMAAPLCFAATGAVILHILLLMGYYRYNLGFGFQKILQHLSMHLLQCVLIIAGTLIMGIFFDCAGQINHKMSVASNGTLAVAPDESQIDRLTKLKGLLDRGIITREEFETKKKQILGS